MYTVQEVEQEPQIDGFLEEAIWEQISSGNNFIQYFPTDSLRAKYQTSFKVFRTETTLYIGFKAYYENEQVVISSLKRDFGALTNDNVSLLFDTFNDGTNAFFFGVTPYGVQREGLVSEGGASFNNTWDVKWRAEAQRFKEYYTVEIAIPLTSLKFVEGATSWRFRAYRWNVQSNEQSTWVQVPQNQLLSSLAYMGRLKFETPLGKSRTPFAIIPYANGIVQKDFTVDNTLQSVKSGVDAKVALSDGLNLDITLNPDFSNVEVDDIFTNLTRFELRLPEKRQFFIDNNDLFENLGNTFSGARPFFSRRIGLAQNKEGALIQNEIIGGLRLSGKINEDWRIGALNIQTAADVDNEIAAFNNLMTTVQRKVGKRSNVNLFLVNRQATARESYRSTDQEYNRVVGADYNLASADNIFRGRLYLHKSLQPGDHKGNFSAQALFFYNPREWLVITDISLVDKDFRADLGFVPRTDVIRLGQAVQRIFYPQKSIFNTHRLMLLLLNDHKPSESFRKTDHTYSLRYEAQFRDLANASIYLSKIYTYLNFSFDPSQKEESIPLPRNTFYNYNQIQLSYESNNKKLLTYGTDITLGQFFNGSIHSFSTDINYRMQPYANIGFNFRYDGIKLPTPYSSNKLLLVSSKLELTFTKKLFWNTLIQYSSKRENFGINSRLQWRFAPLSDLYIVYNDNYISSNPLIPRFRSFNLKLTYWINL
tara:strand:- start:3839 stop:5962 length:2124 start_codon:yes stop_codon:yes gene_type:complete